MTKLDARGYIAIVEIVIYVPILFISLALSFRHGFKRKAGWIMLVVLSIIRIIGGITHVLSEFNPTNITERIIYSIMESAGLSPLLVASLGFLGTVAQYSIEQDPLVPRALRILGLVGTVALVLSIIGGTNAGNATSLDDLHTATNLRHIGAILFVVVFGGVAIMTSYAWLNHDRILQYRRRLLKGITITLPFLLVRTVYAILSSFAPYPVTIVDGHQVPVVPVNTGLGRFSSASPDWWIYLIMSVVAEYAAVLVYTTFGMLTPLAKDIPAYDKALTDSYDGHQMDSYANQQSQYYASR